MPAADLLANRRTGSIALGANRYRYKIIEAGMGLYADCDMYCLSSPDGLGDYVIGREDDFTINSAVLKYPPGSELSRRLLDATEDKYAIPQGIKPSRRLRLRLRRLVGAPKSVEDQPWGVWGPTLVTRLADQLGLLDRIAPTDVFYPVHPRNASLFRAQGLRLADLTTPRTRMVHLWRQLLDPAPPPDGSPLAEIIAT